MFRSVVTKFPVELSPLPSDKTVSKTSCADQALNQEPQTFDFLRLPAEIRVLVYGICLVPDGKPTLRSPKWMLRKVKGDKHQLCDNAILRVCRMTYEEAIPIFFARNRFQHSIDCDTIDQDGLWISKDVMFQGSLHRMRHVSLDVFDMPVPRRSEEYPTVDQLLSKCLDEVIRQCGEDIRSLEIHLLDCNDVCHWGWIPELGEGIPTISAAISKMRPHLQSLTIIGYNCSWSCSSRLLERLCLAIAPDELWEKRRCGSQPGVSHSQSTNLSLKCFLHGTNRTTPIHLDRWQISKTIRSIRAETQGGEHFSESASGFE